MQMLQSDWLSYSYTMSHYSAVAVHRPWQMRYFHRFPEVLEEGLDVNG